METLIGFVILALVLAIVLGAPVILGFKLLQTIFRPFWKRFRYTYFPAADPPGFSLYFKLLSERFPYFLLLTEVEQRRFVGRLRYIRDSKAFIGRGIELTEEMEILISAALTQLTFGLEEFDLENLQNIHVTPESFYSRLVEHRVKGLTFESGRMILSWADFVEGYRIGNDKVNLALHEMAHALMLDYLAYEEIEPYFNEWEKAALDELRAVRIGPNTFLRTYAFTNEAELWACCVESFFETPIEFKKSLPRIYEKMCKALKQDMAARMERTKVFAPQPVV